jgi:uroporphyrinogen-III synthase
MNATREPLGGLRILVTRPASQALSLCRLIEDAGGEACSAPTIDIGPPDDPGQARRLLMDRTAGECVIFVSRNAAVSAASLVPDLAAVLAGRAIYAAGAGTHAELSRLGVTNAGVPSGGEGSEGLLRLAALQEAGVAGRGVLIVRGEGGRELLRTELEKRGAHVRYVEVYSRRRPETSALDGVWRNARPDIIVTTSNQGLENLVEITDAGSRETLFATPLVVTSRRAVSRAAELGFRARVVAAASADDAELLRSLVKLAETLRER